MLSQFRTSVLLNAASAVHSARLVGLERAKIIGLSLKEAMACKISGVKSPGVADAPIKIYKDGFTTKTYEINEMNLLSV